MKGPGCSSGSASSMQALGRILLMGVPADAPPVRVPIASPEGCARCGLVLVVQSWCHALQGTGRSRQLPLALPPVVCGQRRASVLWPGLP